MTFSKRIVSTNHGSTRSFLSVFHTRSTAFKQTHEHTHQKVLSSGVVCDCDDEALTLFDDTTLHEDDTENDKQQTLLRVYRTPGGQKEQLE